MLFLDLGFRVTIEGKASCKWNERTYQRRIGKVKSRNSIIKFTGHSQYLNEVFYLFGSDGGKN